MANGAPEMTNGVLEMANGVPGERNGAPEMRNGTLGEAAPGSGQLIRERFCTAGGPLQSGTQPDGRVREALPPQSQLR